MAKAICLHDGCDKPVKARGLCQRHYWLLWDSTHVYPPCTAEDCDEPARAKGWCQTHYIRWRRTGSIYLPDPLTPEQRFWAKVNKDGPLVLGDLTLPRCSLWTGALNDQGYGRFDPIQEENWYAHAYAWMLAGNEVPRGHDLGLDHLCHTADLRAGLCPGGRDCLHRRCVEVAHLEVVTAGDNTRRGASGRKTHCMYDHPFDEENTYYPPSGGRQCKECRRRRAQEYKERRGY